MSYFATDSYGTFNWGLWIGRHRGVSSYGLSVVTPPASEPVTLDEVKLHLRIDGNYEDSLLSSFITAARAYCEQYTARALITQTLQLYMDAFPWHSFIQIPMPPVQSVSTFTYVDINGATQTVDPSVYMLDTTQNAAYVRLQYNQVWPPSVRRQPQSVQLQYVTGYGAASSVPEAFKVAIKLIVADWYENRENAEAMTTNKRASDAVLMPYRVFEP